MTVKKLTAENAIIKTATVEVKTLTISGKQVTLAVFRQLPHRELINTDTLELLGVPWGIVNYHPDKCGSSSEHIHVVWQKGTTLARMTLFEKLPDSRETLRKQKRVTLNYICALVGEAQLRPKLKDKMNYIWYKSLDFGRDDIQLDENTYWGAGGGNYFTIKIADITYESSPFNYTSRDSWEHIEQFVSHWKSLDSPSSDLLYERLIVAYNNDMDYCQQYYELYDSLANLDQLYIAV